MIEVTICPMPPLSDEAARRLRIAEWAKAWAAKLDKEIVDSLIARGETHRLKLPKAHR